MLFLGLIMTGPKISLFLQGGNQKSLKQRVTSFLTPLILPGLFFPLLFPLSPGIFIVMQCWAIILANSSPLKAQSTLGSRGESILEATPQFALQCYIIISTYTLPGWIKGLSLFTSALTLSLKNIEQYVSECTEMDTFGPMSILKNIAVFSSASLFKVLAASILCVFFKVWAAVIIAGYIMVLNVCLGITLCCYNLGKSERYRQLMECFIMSWLTITNLGRGKTAALFRLVSTLFWTIAHTITLSVILAICHTDPGIVNFSPGKANNINWSECP